MALNAVNNCKKKENFTPTEALKLTNIILKNHKVFENAQKKNINITKKMCQELKNNPAAAVNNLDKLANEKNAKFNFEKAVSPPIAPKKDEKNPLTRKEDELKAPDAKVN